MNELPAPPDAAQDPSAVEVARVWLVGGALHCALQTDVLEPGSWGEVLADVARHVAQSLQDKEGHDPAATLAHIRAVFEEELRLADGPAPG